MKMSSYAIAAILALGAFSLFAFPAIGHALGMSDQAFGLWAGLAVDNTAEATAAGALYSDAAGKFAVLAKTARNATIGFVVLGYAIYWARKSQAAVIDNKASFLWQKFPKFVLGFLLISSAHDGGILLEAPDRRHCQSFALGLSAYLRRCRAAHEYPRNDEAGNPSISCRRDRRVRDCRHHAGDGADAGALLPGLKGELLRDSSSLSSVLGRNWNRPGALTKDGSGKLARKVG